MAGERDPWGSTEVDLVVVVITFYSHYRSVVLSKFIPWLKPKTDEREEEERFLIYDTTATTNCRKCLILNARSRHKLLFWY